MKLVLASLLYFYDCPSVTDYSVYLMYHFFSLLSMHFIVACLDDVFNYSCHSVRMSCSIKKLVLLTLLVVCCFSWAVILS